MKRSISGLETHLGYWLRFVSNHVSHAFALKVSELDVTVAEWVVLRDLYDVQESAPSALAERLGMTRGAISKLIDRLEAKTLVERTVSDQDRRFQAVALSRGGRALVPRLAALADQNDEEFFGHLPPADRARLEIMMRDIIRRRGLRDTPTT